MNFDLSSLDKLSQTQTTAKTSKFAPTARTRPVRNPFLSLLAALPWLLTRQLQTSLKPNGRSGEFIVVLCVSRSGQ